MAKPFDFRSYGLTKNRSGWTQPKSHKTSIPFGKLVPLGMPIDVLPNDIFKCKLGAVIHMLTPLAPLMDGISGDIYAYFTPYRLLFDRTKQFFGENESEAWTLNLTHNLPYINFELFPSAYTPSKEAVGGVYDDDTKFVLTSNYGSGLSLSGSLFDHFELPFVYLNKNQYLNIYNVRSAGKTLNVAIQAMPFRNYQLIWNYDFRNPSVVDPMLDFNYDHSDKFISFSSQDLSYFSLKPVMRYRDLFSSALKAPQRGPAVSIPVNDLALPLKRENSSNPDFLINAPVGDTGESVMVVDATGAPTGKQGALVFSGTSEEDILINVDNFYADFKNINLSTVNALRSAIATQHLYELMTNVFRYHEYTKVFFGIEASPLQLDDPMQLGGIHFDINISQAVTTSDSGGKTTGDLGAFSVTNVRGNIFTRNFQEHGIIQFFVVLRKEHTYCQGLDKYWRKRDFFDIFQPPLEGIGNVDIKRSEIYFGFDEDGKVDDSAFGYAEPYYEYRYMQSRACGLMNPLHPNSLSYYSLTDVLADVPYLNEQFVSEDANGLDNALVASASVTDQFFGDFFFSFDCYRTMKLHEVPGLNRI